MLFVYCSISNPSQKMVSNSRQHVEHIELGSNQRFRLMKIIALWLEDKRIEVLENPLT